MDKAKAAEERKRILEEVRIFLEQASDNGQHFSSTTNERNNESEYIIKVMK